jgi:hypothetical protein
MRVDYTLPALQPAALPETTGAGAALAPAFRDQLRGTRVQLPEGWTHVLGLDARPFSASYIGPPHRPQTLELNDAESERTRWQGLLLRHSDAQSQAAEPGSRAIGRMLQLLQEMQRMEDGLLARCVVATRY